MKINNLTVKYSNYTALDITSSLIFNEGDRIGIIGNNGAGKTTFAKALCGLVNYSGAVESKLTPTDIAIHLQHNAYMPRLRVSIIIEGILNTNIETNTKLKELISFFEFENCLKKRYAQLSGGQQQKMTIILILMQDKPLTFFDEVTSGLDFESRTKLIQTIHKYYETSTKTLCMVSHYFDELENFINKLLIIHQGKVVDFGLVGNLFKKYCGDVVYVFDDNQINQDLTNNFKKLFAPKGKMVISCQSLTEEQTLNQLLVTNKLNFKRSNQDLEILFVNAIGGNSDEV
jgi:ABC-2 type transport system ATP-binding protein